MRTVDNKGKEEMGRRREEGRGERGALLEGDGRSVEREKGGRSRGRGRERDG